jgi:hypothetical protein
MAHLSVVATCLICTPGSSGALDVQVAALRRASGCRGEHPPGSSSRSARVVIALVMPGTTS